MFRKRAQEHIGKNPQLKEGYAALFRGYLFWMNLPWVIMGIGCTVGGIPSVWHYFRPRDGNPYVLAWFGSVFFLWVLGTFWLFLKSGAEMLAGHPGAIELRYGVKRKDLANPRLSDDVVRGHSSPDFSLTPRSTGWRAQCGGYRRRHGPPRVSYVLMRQRDDHCLVS